MFLDEITMSENINLEEKAKQRYKEVEINLNIWQEVLSQEQENKKESISLFLKNCQTLFATKRPEKIEVLLHDHPVENMHKGEPAVGRAAPVDIIYWVSATKEKSQMASSILEKVLHESVHQNFQTGEYFVNLIEDVREGHLVDSKRQELMEGQPDYLDSPEAEMTAIYLENYYRINISNRSSQSGESQPSFINFVVDQNKFIEVYKNIVDDDLQRGKPGPGTKLRRGWGIKDPLVWNNGQTDHHDMSGSSLFQIGEKVRDFGLLEEYIRENKAIDINFINRLYDLFLDSKKGLQE